MSKKLIYVLIVIAIGYTATGVFLGTREYYNSRSNVSQIAKRDDYSQFLIDFDPVIEMHTGLHITIDDCTSFRVSQKDLSEMTEDELLKVLLFRNFVATSTDTDAQEWIGKMLIPQYYLHQCDDTLFGFKVKVKY